MMNKAQKRKLEIEALSDAYNSVESYRDSQHQQILYWQEAKDEILKENPEADTEWYDNNIEEYELKFKTFEKVLEVIFKLM